MRLRLGRPDPAAYADRFDLPAAAGGLGITFLGVGLSLPTVWRRENPW